MLGRTLAGATAGATVGAMVGKSKQTKGSSSPLRPLQRLTSTAKKNKESPNDSTRPTSLSQKVGQVTGRMLGARSRFRANIDHRKEQLNDLPTTAQYAVMQGKEQLKKPVRNFKQGITQAKEDRQKAMNERTDRHRQTIADRRLALDKKRAPSHDSNIHERPVAHKGKDSFQQDRPIKPTVHQKQKIRPVTKTEHIGQTRLQQQQLSSTSRKERPIQTDTDKPKHPVTQGQSSMYEQRSRPRNRQQVINRPSPPLKRTRQKQIKKRSVQTRRRKR